MNKRFLSALLALCMAFAMLPVSAMAEPSPEARWGSVSEGYATPTDWTSGNLADAVSVANSASTGTTYMQLLSDVTTTGLNFTISSSATLDLNGHTLGSGGESAISHSGSGTLTITDGTVEKNGKVVSSALNSNTVYLNGGSLIVEGGTIENAGTTYGCAINNLKGSVEITGGTVYCAGVLGITILNQYGNLSISGGVVRANDGQAIAIFGIGNVTIGGTALITSAGKDTSTIYLYPISLFPANEDNTTVLKITGGTIENTAQTNLQTAATYAIGNYSTYTVEISGGMINATGERGVGILASEGTIVVLSGRSVVKGRYMAMATQPTLSLDAQLRAGKNYESDALEDDYFDLLYTHDVPTSIFGQYKYLRFAPSTAVASINNKFFTKLQDAFDAATNGSTIQLLNDINLLQPALTVYANEVPRDYTLDLNGKTLSSSDRAVIESDSPLTIIDTSYGKTGVIQAVGYCNEAILNSSRLVITDGTVISGENSDYTIRNLFSGTVSIAGGTVISSGDQAHAIYNTSSGTVNVSGGMVSASGADAAAIYDAGSGTVNVSGGMVSASGADAAAIYDAGSCTVNVSDGIISSANSYAIYTNSKNVTISFGWPILKGGLMAMNKAPIFNPAKLAATASTNYSGDPPVAYEARNIETYKYIAVADGPQAQWRMVSAEGATPTDWVRGNLANAVSVANSASTGTTYIQLRSDVSTTGLDFTISSPATLDLNGHILNGGSTSAITHIGSSTLTITDSKPEKNGKVMTTAPHINTIWLSVGSLVVEGGTIENAGNELGCAIYNDWGSVEITGGTVYCAGVGGSTILTCGTLNISGGVVRANDGPAIWMREISNVTISGTALITSAAKSNFIGTICLPSDNQGNATVLKITGGTIENTAQTKLETGYETPVAINNSGTYTVEISGGMINATGDWGIGILGSNIVFLSGRSVVKGRYMSMATQPTLSLDVQLMVKKNYESDALSDTELHLLFPFDVLNYDLHQYKYLRFGPTTAVARIGNKFYRNLREAFDYGASGGTIQLLADIRLGETVFNEKGGTFTLDLNGKKLSCVNSRGPLYNMMGELTITDNSEGGQGCVEGTITNVNKLIIAGGTISATGKNAIAIHSPPRGNAPIIVGGTVSASGDNAVAIKNESGYAVRISGDAVISSTAYAIVTSSAGVIIEGGSPVIQGGKGAINRAPSFNPAELMATASYNYSGDPPMAYEERYIANYKYIDFVPLPVPVENDTSSGIDFGGGNTPPADTTVYNNPSNASSTIWLSGSGLNTDDLLVTQTLTSGSSYNALLKLANREDVFRVYEISLKSGKAANGSAMYLTFDLDAKYAGQAFTLVHKKTDGTFEYFYATADADGKVTFGPIHELSPFMLVKGQLAASGNVSVPNTGGSPTLLPGALIFIAIACGIGVAAYRKKRTQE